jgi:hypothetical protein
MPPSPPPPVNSPEVKPMDAITVLLLAHVPPVVASVNVVVAPAQMLVVPTIFEGVGFTVTVVLVEHPLIE